MSLDTATTVASNGRELVGRVVSKTAKTLTVEVTRLVKHARYHKYVKQTKNYKAHGDDAAFENGDVVVIHETRPLSKTKRWVVVGRR